jgi:DNA-binding CsgD family transcriptional regulator
LDRAERVASAAGEWRALSYVYLVRADWHEMSGELLEALMDRQSAAASAEHSGETERLAFSHLVVADSCLWVGAWEEGRVAVRAGLDLDPYDLLRSQPGLAHLAWMEGRPIESLQRMRTYLIQARQRGDLQGVATGLVRLGELALQVDHPEEAEAPLREATELLRVDGAWLPWLGWVYGAMAETAARLATADAWEILSVAEDTIERSTQYFGRPQVLRARALLHQHQRRFDAALEEFAASAAGHRAQHSTLKLGWTLHTLAGVARQCGESKLAEDSDAERLELVQRIGPEVRALPWARDTAAAGTAKGTASVARRSTTTASGGLTRREREVALLIARGLTNRQIADALTIAEGTAGVHVDHVLGKLGFRSRAQVAAWAVKYLVNDNR